MGFNINGENQMSTILTQTFLNSDILVKIKYNDFNEKPNRFSGGLKNIILK